MNAFLLIQTKCKGSGKNDSLAFVIVLCLVIKIEIHINWFFNLILHTPSEK